MDDGRTGSLIVQFDTNNRFGLRPNIFVRLFALMFLTVHFGLKFLVLILETNHFLAKPNAAIYYVHGGVHQRLDFSKRYLREMAKSTGATVIAPDYRRAPQHQFPGPFDDCLAGKSPNSHM